jgi:Uncharacterised nucleotidyltransferase
MARDLYLLHRAALAPLLPGATGRELEQAIDRALAAGEMPFAQFLCEQGLAPLWDERLEHHAQAARLSQEFRSALHHNRLQVTGDYLLHRHNLAKIKEILDTAGIAHVVTKGSHTRELYYDTPALRPALDIDILVRPGDRLEAIRVFQAGGFSFHGLTETISHECGLIKGNTCIDLHWDIMRPGRTRKPMVDALLNSRVDYGSHWGPGHGETLFLMLAHPVFTKYSTTPHARLVRLVDLAQLLHRYPGSVEDAVPLLRAAGLATAGWITSTWLDLLSPGTGALAHSIAPSRLRRSYLRQWLTHNLSTRLLGKPLLIQLGFTLPAHDTLRDAARAVLHARRHGQTAGTTLAATQSQVPSPP